MRAFGIITSASKACLKPPFAPEQRQCSWAGDADQEAAAAGVPEVGKEATYAPCRGACRLHQGRNSTCMEARSRGTLAHVLLHSLYSMMVWLEDGDLGAEHGCTQAAVVYMTLWLPALGSVMCWGRMRPWLC